MPWTWETPTTRAPSVVFVVFSPGELELAPLSLSAHGVTPAGLAQLELRRIPRSADPAWFDGWRTGALRNIARADLQDLAELDAAEVLHLVRAAPQAPSDLAWLQAAWGAARWLAASGASLLLDVHAHRFWRAAALPAADAPFDAARELRVVFETDSTRTDMAHAVHTRGLAKFGAPDLVALCGQEDAALVGEVIAELAARVAGGLDLRSPRHVVQVSPAEAWWVVPDVEGLADLLQLNNAARMILDGRGRHLVGTAARWAARVRES